MTPTEPTPRRCTGRRRWSSLSSLLNLAYRVAKKLGLYQRFAPRFEAAERYIRGAGLKLRPVEGYVALMILASVFGPPAGIGVGALLAILAVQRASLLLALLAALAVFAGIASPAILMTIPMFMCSSRASKLQARLPYLLLFASSLLSGGYSVERAMLRLYARRDVLGFEIELSDIVKQLVMAGEDVVRALRRVALYTPLHEFAVFLDGLAGLSESGTGVADFVYTFFNDVLFRMESVMSQVTNSLSLISEVFVAGAVVLPCILASLLLGVAVTGGLVGTLAMDPYLMLGATTFLIVPLITVATIVLVDAELSKVRG